jgi:hypothetical protein
VSEKFPASIEERKLAQFVALTDGVEVTGQTILSFLLGLGNHKDMALKVLESHSIVNLEPRKWYSQQAWLDSFKELAKIFHPNTLTYLGRKIPENSNFPQEFNDISLALQSIDWAYHLNHRIDGVVLFNYASGVMKEGIGHYLFEQTDPHKVILKCNTPYPCDFDRGIIDAIAFRFRPPGTTPRVIHDDASRCRKNGEDSCTYVIEW